MDQMAPSASNEWSDPIAVHNSSGPQSDPGGLGAHLGGGDLYQKLVNYLEEYLQQLRQEAERHTGKALLNFFAEEGKRYITAAKYIHRIFTYLNRHWIQRERDEGRPDIYRVYTLHLVVWHKVVLSKEMSPDVSAQLKNSVLQLVEEQHNGEAIEYGQMKEVVDFFLSFTLDEEDLPVQIVSFYRDCFEDPFLEASRRFYDAKSKQLIPENNVAECMRNIAVCVDEEVQCGELYLPGSTVSRLRQCCYTALVGDYFDLLVNEFLASLDHSRVGDTARVYRLLSPISGGRDCLEQKFENHVRKKGLDVVAKGMETLGSQGYMGTLVNIYAQYREIVKEAFDDQPGFMQSLHKACREFVNSNGNGNFGASKQPELLVNYTDMLLRNTVEHKLEDRLEAVTATLNYMENKDVFQMYYSRMLARRLLHAHSSDDAEMSMINKFEKICGFDYANKLRRMLGDMKISKDLNTEFREGASQLRYGLGSLGSCSILSANAWPLQAPETDFNPPAEISADCDRFSRFYETKHKSHKLTWLWQLCRVELKTNYCKKPYIFHVSIYQMAVLLLFNEKDVNTYDNIQATTRLESNVLDPTLWALSNKFKVLLVLPEESIASPGRVFQLNYDFKCAKIKVNLNQYAIKVDAAEKKTIYKAVERDRELSMQSVIVRIMKARKKMMYSQLVSETISQVQTHFKPEISDIKKCIESLLDREYLKRVENDELEYFSPEPHETLGATAAAISRS